MNTSISEKAARHLDQTVETLVNLISFKSLSCHEKDIINYIESTLKGFNFDEVWTDKLGNLIGRIGYGKKVLAFDAHIDVVDAGDISQWNSNPFSALINDEKIYGRGAVDQKSGAAAMITAGKILKEMNYEGIFSIFFTFTIMEEDCDGLCWDFLIEEEGLKPDYAVITEPTNLGLYIGHRGRMEIEVSFRGISAHASAPERGLNAINKASLSVLELDKLSLQLKDHSFLGKGSLAVTEIKSSSPSLCAIPDFCKIHVDRRLTYGEKKASSIDEIEKSLKNKIEKNLFSVKIPIYKKKSYKGTIHTMEKYFPTWLTDKSHPLVRAGIKTYQNIFNKRPAPGKWTFSTNGIALSGKHKIPTIGFGPGNEIYSHAPNEYLPIVHLREAVRFYVNLPYILEKYVT